MGLYSNRVNKKPEPKTWQLIVVYISRGMLGKRMTRLCVDSVT